MKRYESPDLEWLLLHGQPIVTVSLDLDQDDDDAGDVTLPFVPFK